MPINLKGFVPGQQVSRGRFKLVRLLGQGGMGVVWLAEDTRLGVPVALKFLPSVVSNDPAALDLLRAETRRCLALSHPHIVRIHDFHEAPGEEVFFSMEFVDGPTLNALRMQQTARVLRWDFLAPLVRQLCDSLDYAHSEKVVHRDLKPSNLILDSKGRLKLSDFGVSRVVTDTLSRLTGGAPGGGTLVYMGPQQLEGGPPLVTDDIYSLGATLYELLTSQPPFVTGDISYQVRQVAAQPLSARLQQLAIQNELPPEVETTVEACLAKDPAVRPQSASEVSRRLGLAGAEPAFQSAPATEARPSHRGSVARRRLASAIGLAVVAITTIAFWQVLRRTPSRMPVAGKPWENTLGMKFKPVGNLLFSIWETRVQDFEAFVRSSNDNSPMPMDSLGQDGWGPHGHSWKEPGYSQGPNYPVCGMKWDDGVAFCAWLTKQEQQLGRLDLSQRYRLPTDDEWSQAVEEHQFQFPWGNSSVPAARAGNYAGKEVKADRARSMTRPNLESYSDDFQRASPVGSFPPNRFGLFDLGGNVLEWCEDNLGVTSDVQLLRGGSWDSSSEEELQSSYRFNIPSGHRSGQYGFRCVLDLGVPTRRAALGTNATTSGSPATVLTNSLGWHLIPVDKVWIASVETRVQDYAGFVRVTGYGPTNTDSVFHVNPWVTAGHSWQQPGFSQDGAHPVVGVHFDDALAFCRWLTDEERHRAKIGPQQRYRLPTDEEWSQAVRLAEVRFPWGNTWPPPLEAGNYGLNEGEDRFEQTAPVGSFKPNALGFYDLGGNVAEWCLGRRGNASSIGVRGGSWQDRFINDLQSSRRSLSGFRSPVVGFRCVLEGPPGSR